MRATNNGELRAALDSAEAAWASCAAVVDVIVECQAQADAEKGRAND